MHIHSFIYVYTNYWYSIGVIIQVSQQLKTVMYFQLGRDLWSSHTKVGVAEGQDTQPACTIASFPSLPTVQFLIIYSA